MSVMDKRMAIIAGGLAIWLCSWAAPAHAQSPEVAELMKQLRDPDWDIRMEAATRLGYLGAEAKPALPALVQALGDPVPAVRMKAVDTLGVLGPDPESLKAVLGMLQDRDVLVRVSTAYALPKLGAKPEVAVGALTGKLKDPAPEVRRAAAVAILPLDRTHREAIALMRQDLQSENGIFRVQACRLLARSLPPTELPALIDVLGNVLETGEPDARAAAARLLGGMGASTVPLLTRTARDQKESANVRTAAFNSLAQIGPEAKAAVPALKELVAERGRWGQAAALVLRRIEGSEPATRRRAVGSRARPSPPASPPPSAAPERERP